jgi:hypothetical protein
MLRPRLKIVFYSGAPRSGTKSQYSGPAVFARRPAPPSSSGQDVAAWSALAMTRSSQAMPTDRNTRLR